jgi:flagellin
MSLRINQNIPAMNAYNNLRTNSDQMSKSLERLSSGFRINRAADDAAGLSVSEGLRAQIGGLQVAVRNAQDGINVVQTAEGAMNEVHSILQRMRDLAVQASNTGSQDTSARQAAQSEVTQLNAELDRIGSTTRFGGQQLLAGQTAEIDGAVTGGTTGAAVGFSFGLTGTFTKTDGTTATLTGAAVATGLVNVADGTYNSAATYQTALQTGINTTLQAAGISPNAVQAKVTDAGGGVWRVAISTADVGAGNTFGITGTTNNATAGPFGGVTDTAASSAQSNAFTGTFQIGANAGENLNVSFNGISSQILSTSTLDLVGNPSNSISTIDTAIQTVSDDRAGLGAIQNRFEHTINSLNVAVQNLSASESQIRDTDMASEMVSFTKSQILSQAGTAMLAQANQAPQSVLKLLQ